MVIWGGEDVVLIWKICVWVYYWPLMKHSVGTPMHSHLFIISWCLIALQVIRITCSKKLVMPVETVNKSHRTNVFTRSLSGVQESLTRQGGNILNIPTCLSIGSTQLYVYCSTVYQLRAVHACAIIGTLLPMALVDLEFRQHRTVSVVVDTRLERVGGECVVLWCSHPYPLSSLFTKTYIRVFLTVYRKRNLYSFLFEKRVQRLNDHNMFNFFVHKVMNIIPLN